MRARLKDMEQHVPVQARLRVEFDEEHRTYSVTFTDAQGAPRTIDWALAARRSPANCWPSTRRFASSWPGRSSSSTPARAAAAAAGQTPEEAEQELEDAEEVELEGATRCRCARYEAEAKPVKRSAKVSQDPVEKKTPREVFEYVIEQGRKEYQVQRYKGLGEMTAPQLWETTMDPARRTLMQVKLEDIVATDEIFTVLMGEDVESRRKFIEENALDVKNLDI